MHPSDQDWPRCACGCGEAVPARKANCTARGFVKGEPCRYVAGHSSRALRKPPVNGELRCPKCQTTKPTTEFHRSKGRPSGFAGWCKDCQAAKSRDWYQRNRQRVLAATAKYHAEHREAQVARVLRYQKTGKGRVATRKSASAYRARKRNLFVEHVDPIKVFERDGATCGICELPIVGVFDVDHIVPLAKGGQHSYANVQAAHPSCNYSKKDRI